MSTALEFDFRGWPKGPHVSYIYIKSGVDCHYAICTEGREFTIFRVIDYDDGACPVLEFQPCYNTEVGRNLILLQRDKTNHDTYHTALITMTQTRHIWISDAIRIFDTIDPYVDVHLFTNGQTAITWVVDANRSYYLEEQVMRLNGVNDRKMTRFKMCWVTR